MPAGRFKKPCAAQSLLNELNAASSCVERLWRAFFCGSLSVLNEFVGVRGVAWLAVVDVGEPSLLSIEAEILGSDPLTLAFEDTDEGDEASFPLIKIVFLSAVFSRVWSEDANA